MDTVYKADHLAGTVSERTGPVSVCLLRLMTSRGASPDTRALACVGSFATTPGASVVDVEAFGGTDELAVL